jgi:WD40 repeat protein
MLQGPIFAVRFSKDGRWLLTASLDNTACLWDVHAKRLNTQFRAHTGALFVPFFSVFSFVGFSPRAFFFSVWCCE